MIAEKGDVQEQCDLAVKERRWTDAARFRDAITQHDRQRQMQPPNRMHQQIKTETSLQPHLGQF